MIITCGTSGMYYVGELVTFEYKQINGFSTEPSVSFSYFEVENVPPGNLRAFK